MAVFTGNGTVTAPSFTFSSDTNTGIFRPGVDQLGLVTNGVTRLFINEIGRVGLGTSGPASLFEFAAGAGNDGIRLSDANYDGDGSTFSYTALSYWARSQAVRRTSGDPISTNGATAAIVFTDRPGTLNFANNLRSSDIRFYTATNGGTSFGSVDPALRMCITAEGRVGIGTTSPNAPLEVAGNIHVSGADRSIFNRSSNALTFGTNNTERARIDSTGRLGLGLTAPAELLDVNGTARLRGRMLGRQFFHNANTGLASATSITVTISTTGFSRTCIVANIYVRGEFSIQNRRGFAHFTVYSCSDGTGPAVQTILAPTGALVCSTPVIASHTNSTLTITYTVGSGADHRHTVQGYNLGSDFADYQVTDVSVTGA